MSESTVFFDGKALVHHGWAQCHDSLPCSIHRPSDHELREYPLTWNSDWNLMVRVKDGVPVPDPDEWRAIKGYILRNSFFCTKCGVEVVSKHRHDFAGCGCGNFTDGGHDYIRRGGDISVMRDTSLTL